MHIVFTGTGSFIFTRRPVVDPFTFDDLTCSELVLMDIHPGRLETAAVAKVITTDRNTALDESDNVFATDKPTGFEARKHEVMVTLAHGVPAAEGRADQYRARLRPKAVVANVPDCRRQTTVGTPFHDRRAQRRTHRQRVTLIELPC